MIRLAAESDIDRIEEIYLSVTEDPEKQKTTGWITGVYPTRKTAEYALKTGTLYVCEREGNIVATLRIDRNQVDVYKEYDWAFKYGDDEVLVLHTLVVDGRSAGSGIGSECAAYYEDMAKRLGCKALRIDTNALNRPAREFYKALGYREAGIVNCTFNDLMNIDLVGLEKEITD